MTPALVLLLALGSPVLAYTAAAWVSLTVESRRGGEGA